MSRQKRGRRTGVCLCGQRAWTMTAYKCIDCLICKQHAMLAAERRQDGE